MEEQHGEKTAADEPTALDAPRVNFELTPQVHASFLDSQLSAVQEDLNKYRFADDTISVPRRFVSALIGDSQSLLEGIEHGKLTKGSSRIASNLVKAVELLEQAGRTYDAQINGLLNVILRASQLGLTIDGCPLVDNKYIDRVKG